jgi:hypothetical protein
MIRRLLNWFQQQFGRAGTYTTEDGIILHVRANGTTYLDSEELRKVLDRLDKKMLGNIIEEIGTDEPCGCCVPDPCYGNSRCVGR